jgi:hypothetical protein
MLKVRIVDDHDTGSPLKEFSNVSKIVLFGKVKHLGDEHNYDARGGIDFVKEVCEEECGGDEGFAAITDIYVYEHGGMLVSTTPFGDKWDSWRAGFAYVTMETAREESSAADEAGLREWAKSAIEDEVGTLAQYVSGDVHGFEVYDDDTDEIVESCYGFYGEDYCREEAEGALKYCVEQAEADAFDAEEKSWEDMGALLEATAA